MVRKEEERNRAFLITKAAIQEGLERGVSPKIRTAEEIVKFAEKRALGKTDLKQHG